MCSSKNIEKKNVLKFVNTLLIYFKYLHSPSIHYLHLINEFHQISKRKLQIIICDIYKRSAEMEITGMKFTPFTPIKVCDRACGRCENTFTVSINQFKTVAPGFSQFRQNIVAKRFSDHPAIDYLNIIDYSRKAYKFVPSSLIKRYENNVCHRLLIYFDSTIDRCHPHQLFYILPKQVWVLKLLNLERNSNTCQTLFSLLVDAIRLKTFDEPLLLIEVWKSLLISDRLIVCAFEKLTDHFPSRSKEKLRWVLVMANYLKFDLHGAWVRGNKLKNFSNCPVTSAMLTGDYEQMKTLLDYGFLPHSQGFARHNIYVRQFNRMVINDGERVFLPLGKNFIIREVHFFLVIRSSQTETSITTRMDKCFRLLWSLIPHPLVSKMQLAEESAEILVQYQGCRRMRDYFIELIETYSNMDLDIGDYANPRDLQHLCKCKIRQCLTVAYNLPQGVEQLPLCKKLQNYLLVPEEHEFN